MKKVLTILFGLLSTTAFIYSVIKCYHFLYATSFVLAGSCMLFALFVLRDYISVGKRLCINILFAINIFFAIGAIGSLFYIYNKYDDKITYSITEKSTIEELGLLVAEYRQANHVNIENTDIKAEMFVAYKSNYEIFNDRSKIRVNPKLYDFIISMSGNKVVDLFDWRNKKYGFNKSYVELTTIRKNNDGTPVYTTGYKDYVDSVKTLPDTITISINKHQTRKKIDSLVFVKNKVYNSESVRKGSKEFFITRKRSFIDKVKDLYLID